MNISIIGTGYVGLVTGACMAKIGHKVIGVDIDEKKVEDLKKGIVPFYEPDLEDLVKKQVSRGNLSFTVSMEDAIKFSEIIFICVGTPSRDDGKADLSFVEAASVDIAKNADSDKIIVEKSTVPVNTGEFIKNKISSYKKENVNLYIVSNPEFLREGSAVNYFMNPDRIVVGAEEDEARRKMLEVYDYFKKEKNVPILVTSRKSAELIKQASNSMLALKISYINLVSQICDKVGANVEEVSKGMGMDHRVGNSFLKAGIGYGGSCFPKDVKAFIEVMNELGINAQLLKSVENINQLQRRYFCNKIADSLGTLKGKTVGVLGLSFKPETDDMREAPSITVVNYLLEKEAIIKVYDPKAIKNAQKIWGGKIKYCENLYETAENADGLVIATEWSEFKDIDMNKILNLLNSPKIIDGRNIFNPDYMKKLGFEYKSVGRL